MSEEMDDKYNNPEWVIENAIDTLNKPVLVQLHRNIVLTKINNLDFFYKYRFYYSTLLMGVLSASIGIFLYIMSSPAVIFFVPLPLSVVVIAVFAQHTVWRYYRRFLEAVVFEAKIENLLGLDEPFKTSDKPSKSPWPLDEYVAVERYHESRFNSEWLTSTEWVEARTGSGDSKNASRTFTFFMIIGCIYAILTIYIGLVNLNVGEIVSLMVTSSFLVVGALLYLYYVRSRARSPARARAGSPWAN